MPGFSGCLDARCLCGTIQEFENHIERANQTPFSSFLPPLPFDPLGPIRPYGEAAEWFTDGISQGAQDFWNKEWTYDWGTGGAAVINIVYGTYKVSKGLTALRALPVSGAAGPAAPAAAGALLLSGLGNTSTGALRIKRCVEQEWHVVQNPKCETECTTGDNVRRMFEGVTPTIGGGPIEILEGLI